MHEGKRQKKNLTGQGALTALVKLYITLYGILSLLYQVINTFCTWTFASTRHSLDRYGYLVNFI